MNCVFCSIADGADMNHEIVWSDKDHVAFLNAHPNTPGHTLVIPRTHVDYVFDLTAEAYQSLLGASRKLAGPLKEVTNAKRIALAIDGFHVPHAHVHLIPAHQSGDICRPHTDLPAEKTREMGDALRLAFARSI